MIVVVDANALVGDPEFRSETWTQLREAVQRRRVRVLVPELVIDEAVAKRKEKLRAVGKKLRREVGSAPDEVRRLVEQAQREALRIASQYEEVFRDRWARFGFEVTSTSTAGHLEVARRAINRLRPFNDQGGGYRDTVHWLTLIDLARHSPHEDVVFISEDGIFSNRQNELVASLVEEFGFVSNATVRLCRKLSDLVVPGHFIGDPVDAPQYESSLRERLLDELKSEYAIHKIGSAGITVPYSDWDELADVSRLSFSRITSQEVAQQPLPEVKFSATAIFTVLGTYIHDDASDMPEISTKAIDIAVEITGIATTLDRDRVGALRDVFAKALDDDLHLVNEIQRAGSQGITPALRSDLERAFGVQAVSRVEMNIRDSEG